MVTAKQWPFYVVPALPFFILAVGFFVKQGFEDLLILFFRKKLLWRTGALILGLGIVSLTLINTQRYRSAPYYWEQWEVFFETIPEEVTLTTCPLLARDFSLHAYARRFGNVHLFLNKGVSEYHLSHINVDGQTPHRYWPQGHGAISSGKNKTNKFSRYGVS